MTAERLTAVEVRLKGVETRLKSVEEKQDTILGFIERGKGGWRAIVIVGTALAALVGIIIAVKGLLPK